MTWNMLSPKPLRDPETQRAIKAFAMRKQYGRIEACARAYWYATLVECERGDGVQWRAVAREVLTQ